MVGRVMRGDALRESQARRVVFGMPAECKQPEGTQRGGEGERIGRPALGVHLHRGQRIRRPALHQMQQQRDVRLLARAGRCGAVARQDDRGAGLLHAAARKKHECLRGVRDGEIGVERECALHGGQATAPGMQLVIDRLDIGLCGLGARASQGQAQRVDVHADCRVGSATSPRPVARG